MPDKWYLAICQQCEPILPQPFRDEGKRDAWADAHETTGHVVVRVEQDGEDGTPMVRGDNEDIPLPQSASDYVPSPKHVRYAPVLQVRNLEDLEAFASQIRGQVTYLVEEAAEAQRAGRLAEMGDLKPSPSDVAPMVQRLVRMMKALEVVAGEFRDGVKQCARECGIELATVGGKNHRTQRPQLRVMDPAGGGPLIIDPHYRTGVEVDTEQFAMLLADEVMRRVEFNPEAPGTSMRSAAIAAINELLRYTGKPAWSITALDALGKVYEERGDTGRKGILERAVTRVREVTDEFEVSRYVNGKKAKA